MGCTWWAEISHYVIIESTSFHCQRESWEFNSAGDAMNALGYSTLNMSTRPYQQGESIYLFMTEIATNLVSIFLHIAWEYFSWHKKVLVAPWILRVGKKYLTYVVALHGNVEKLSHGFYLLLFFFVRQLRSTLTNTPPQKKLVKLRHNNETKMKVSALSWFTLPRRTATPQKKNVSQLSKIMVQGFEANFFHLSLEPDRADYRKQLPRMYRIT